MNEQQDTAEHSGLLLAVTPLEDSVVEHGDDGGGEGSDGSEGGGDY